MGFVLGDCEVRGGLVEGEEVLGYGGADCVLFGVGGEGFEGFGRVGGGPENVVVGRYVDGWWGGSLLLGEGGELWFGLWWWVSFGDIEGEIGNEI